MTILRAIIAHLRREPVRWLAGLQVLWIAAINGLIIFDAWAPTNDQLQYTLGIPIVLANIFGFSIVRDAVTPNTKLPDTVVARAAQDHGQGIIATIVLIVVVVLAMYGAALLFDWI